MALIVGKLYRAYHVLFNELSDPRTSAWPLMSSPFPPIIILGAYLYFVTNLGPRMMKNKEAFKLKGVMIVYNIVQILACAYVMIQGMNIGWWSRYKWFCEPVDFSNSSHALGVAHLVYFYFILKVLDLTDTVFFVLRKKEGHISFLHVYHHTGMVVLLWSCCKFLPGGHGTSLGIINSFVHVVMYSYYLLCLLDEKYRKSIWWKKHITQLQIVQFMLITSHFLGLFAFNECGYPKWVALVMVPQNFFMMTLFIDFYIKAYVKKKAPKAHQNGIEDEHGEGKQRNGFKSHVVENGTKHE